MNDTWDSADIDQAKADLRAAGWTEEDAITWKAPDGSRHRGPAGAWKTMKRAQNDVRAVPPASAVDLDTRLLELASLGAYANHDDVYRLPTRRPEDIVDGHTAVFATCPHPDCELVRAALPPRPVGPAVDLDTKVWQENVFNGLKALRDALWNKSRSPDGFQERRDYDYAHRINDIINVLGKALRAVRARERPQPVRFQALRDAVVALDFAARDDQRQGVWTNARWAVFNAAVRLVKETDAAVGAHPQPDQELK